MSILLFGRKMRYLLRDEFTTNLAAGSVNGTAAEPGPGTRVVVDSENKLSIAGGLLTFAGGPVTPTYGNPAIWYPAITRASGIVLLGELNIASGSNMVFGLDVDTVGIINGNGIIFAGTVLKLYENTTFGPIVGSFATATDYKVAMVQRGTGIFYFIKGGVFTSWTLLWVSVLNNTATLYPSVNNYDMVFTADFTRTPSQLWLPVPLLSDSFNRANGALGNTDGAGHAEANGGGGLTWQFVSGIWTIATNKAVGSPVAGATLWDAAAAVFTSGTYGWVALGTNTIANDVNQLLITYVDNASGAYVYLRDAIDLSADLTVGVWYRYDVDARVGVGDSVGLFLSPDGTVTLIGQIVAETSLTTKTMVFRATHATAGFLKAGLMETGEELWLDNLVLSPLTLSELFSTIDIGQNNIIASVDLVIYKGTVGGLVLNLDSAVTPANFVIAYHNGISAILEKCVAGVYTTVISAAATYAANATLRVIKDGTSYSLFYNNAKVGSTGTISDAGIISNTRHGLFNTYSGNTLDNAVVWSRKTGYSKLDRF